MLQAYFHVQHMSIPGLVAGSRFMELFDLYAKIRAFPSVLFRPEKSEDRFSSRGQRRSWQIEDVNSQARVTGVGVVRAGPVVDAPVDRGWREQGDSQSFVSGDAAGFVIEAPPEDLAHVLFLQVALHGLRRL